MNLPNKLTVARCIMTIVFVGLMSCGHVVSTFVAYLVFIAASVTDYYDGKIARERNLVTNFGKLLDPVADKLLLISAFIMLMEIPELRVPGWSVIIILAREFLVTGARSIAAAEGEVIAANQWGKTKTVLQMIYVFTFLLMALVIQALEQMHILANLDNETTVIVLNVIRQASFIGILLVAAFTVHSGIQFAWANRKLFNMDSCK